jgi:hypothetical protein
MFKTSGGGGGDGDGNYNNNVNSKKVSRNRLLLANLAACRDIVYRSEKAKTE